MTMKFEDCPPYVLSWGKSCGQGVLRKIDSQIIYKFFLAAMYGLQIKEANSILSMPIMYKDGEIKENKIIIPPNMD